MDDPDIKLGQDGFIVRDAHGEGSGAALDD
jgi:hypothetical protein